MQFRPGTGLKQMLAANIVARIPHQSPPGGGDSFPPGEALGAAVPKDLPQNANYVVNPTSEPTSHIT